MNTDEEEFDENAKPVVQSSQTIRKVSRVTFDEKTGTVTLKIASEEEIAEAEKGKS